MIGIPLRDNNPTVRTPFLTYLLLMVNIVVFVYQLSLHPSAEQRLFYTLGAIPSDIIRLSSLETLLTSMFIHGGWLHLLGNMLYLYIFGDNVEDLLGHSKFLGFYFLCGFGAVLSHIVIDPLSNLPMIGASGAISGVLGAYVVSFPRARVLVAVPIIFYIKTFWIPSIVALGIWFLIQLLFGILSIGESGGIAWFAHIGGFLAGMLLIKLVYKPKLQNHRNYEDEFDEWEN